MSATYEDFLRASTLERMRLALDDSNRKMLVQHLGQTGLAEYRRLGKGFSGNYLAADVPPNLIFVPGVMGSLLANELIGGIWWIDFRTRHHIDDLALGPTGEQEANPNNRIIPVTSDPSYEPFTIEVLRQQDFGHRIFAYDWRKPLKSSAERFKEVVDQLHQENGRRPIHVVAHSMGGLAVRTALMVHGDFLWKRIGRIVFIGTPHYGSTAIVGYLKNHLHGFELMAVLGRFLSRDTFRSLWGVLALLPAPRGIYPGTRAEDIPQWSPVDPIEGEGANYIHPCVNFDVYRADEWDLGLSEPVREKVESGEAVVIPWSALLSGRRTDVESRDPPHLRP